MAKENRIHVVVPGKYVVYSVEGKDNIWFTTIAHEQNESYKYRDFLNEDKSMIGLVSASPGDLTIGDCSRQVHIDFTLEFCYDINIKDAKNLRELLSDVDKEHAKLIKKLDKIKQGVKLIENSLAIKHAALRAAARVAYSEQKKRVKKDASVSMNITETNYNPPRQILDALEKTSK